jgi:hypothetical protein
VAIPGKPITVRPKGVSDAIDGSNTFAGAMRSLANLITAPSTPNVFVPRPAAVSAYNFANITDPGVPSAILIQGTRVYGMVPSDRFPGYDEPFCYDLFLQAAIPISGVTAANCPASISPNGDWVPPVIVAVTNARIIVTHPGFPGGNGPYFGWFDISSFNSTTLKGNTTSGSPIIQSIQTPGGNSAPIASGVQPGQAIAGAGIPANETVLSATNGTFDVSTTGTYTATSPIVTGIPSTAGFQVGMTVDGVGPPIGAVILTVDSSSQITMSGNAISSGTAALVVSGGGTITMSANATATATNVALTITGGTLAAPLWGAGNTNGNALFAVPTCVGQYNSRAWYGVGNYAVYSDALNPTQVTNASQALQIGDSTSITALSGLPLTSQVTGGILQALIVFKGGGPLTQITGDAATNNLADNVITGSVGTLAPNTICATPSGLAFMATDGLRILSLAATLGDPIGVNGRGVSLPFINTINPSRMCAAFGQNVYRITTKNIGAAAQPEQEYWYDFNEKAWNGPHSFPYALIEAYTDPGGLYDFIGAGYGIAGMLWGSTAVPLNSSTYVENGQPLNWTYSTTLLPDNNEGVMNQIIQTTLAMALSSADIVRVVAYNEQGGALDTAYVQGLNVPSTKWGQFLWGRANYSAPPGSGGDWGSAEWGGFNWGALTGSFCQYPVSWHGPLVEKQMFFEVTGTSASGQAIGNAYAKYRALGYQLQGAGIGP